MEFAHFKNLVFRTKNLKIKKYLLKASLLLQMESKHNFKSNLESAPWDKFYLKMNAKFVKVGHIHLLRDKVNV